MSVRYLKKRRSCACGDRIIHIYIWTRPQRGAGGVDSCESRVLQKSVCRQIVLINQGGTDVWRVSDKKSVYDETGETRVDAS